MCQNSGLKHKGWKTPMWWFSIQIPKLLKTRNVESRRTAILLSTCFAHFEQKVLNRTSTRIMEKHSSRICSTFRRIHATGQWSEGCKSPYEALPSHLWVFRVIIPDSIRKIGFLLLFSLIFFALYLMDCTIYSSVPSDSQWFSIFFLEVKIK